MQATSTTLTELSTAYADLAEALTRHCRFRLFNQQDAEEVVQETFVKACEYVKRGKKIENLRVFLYRVANNLIVDFVRREKKWREKLVSLDELREKGFDLKIGDGTGRVHQRLEAREILTAVRELERDDYDLMVMRFVDGLMPADIAVVTGLTANVVSVRLHRAVKEVSSSLKNA